MTKRKLFINGVYQMQVTAVESLQVLAILDEAGVIVDYVSTQSDSVRIYTKEGA